MVSHSVPETALVEAHRHCALNEGEIASSTICGCFYCLEVFSPSEISEWIDDTIHGKDGRTALCPKCRIDSVIGSSAGFLITAEFLGAMRWRWFERTVHADGGDTSPGKMKMNFSRAYLLFINLSALLFGAMALLVGIGFLVSAYAVAANRALDLIVGISAIAVGVAVFKAKPITDEDIVRIRRKMGRPERET
jgi:hypothetical protein